jgi:hypothetical protein
MSKTGQPSETHRRASSIRGEECCGANPASAAWDGNATERLQGLLHVIPANRWCEPALYLLPLFAAKMPLSAWFLVRGVDARQ